MSRAEGIMKINEYEVSPGLMNAIGTHPKQSNVTCGDCKFQFPTYPGRYPQSCPKCGSNNLGAPIAAEDTNPEDLVDNKDWKEDKC